MPVLDSLCLSSIRRASPRYPVLVLDMLCLSSIRCVCLKYPVLVLDTLCLSSIGCACPQYDVPVLDTLCLSSIGCACAQYAVPVLSTLCLSSIRCACRKYVELAFRCACQPIRNRILTLIPLYLRVILRWSRTTGTRKSCHGLPWSLPCGTETVRDNLVEILQNQLPENQD